MHNLTRMKCLPPLLIMIASISAQSQVRENTVTFISPGRTFEFKYPQSYVICRRNPQQPDNWMDDACLAYTPICSNYQCLSSDTMVCIGYPHDRTLEGTNFDGAAFSVSIDPHAGTKDGCSRMAEPPPRVGQAREVVVNGTKFQLVQTDGVGAGNFLDGYAYRAFYQHTCYELDIRIAYSSIANDDPGTRREFDSEKVRARLESVLKSFRFRR